MPTSPPVSEPVVSIVVPTYGRPERLRMLLEQLLAQDADCSAYEIIVVDDGSPEPIASAIQSICERDVVSVRCLTKQNGGPSSARNFGALTASGEFLLFVDDDMSVPRDFVSAHIETQRQFGPALVSCFFDWRVESDDTPFGGWYRRRITQWNDVRKSDLRPLSEDVFQMSSVLVTTANLSVKRSDFESIGGFDVGYAAAGCEDQDFSLRLAQAGVNALMTRKTVAIHMETHVTLKQLSERQRRGARDSVRFVRRFADLCGQPALATVNGKTFWFTDPWRLTMKKQVKQIMSWRYALPAVFRTVRFLERVAPNSRLLQRLYDLVIGAHIQTGWREGLKEYSDVPKLDMAPVVES